ncbi:MAG: cupin domain-containing protein [Betaproteobacteria bacterium]
MVCIVSETTTEAEVFGNRSTRRKLLTKARIPASRVLADRISIGAGGSGRLSVPAGSLAWFQMLRGTLMLRHGECTEPLCETSVVLLPPKFDGTAESETGAELLYAEVPDAAALDPDVVAKPPVFKIIDWSREPVLDSKFDARKRIYVATPKLLGTKAIKAEIVIYPKATTGSNHHHEGAEHFMYMIKGSTTGYSNEEPHRYKAGDLVYHPDGERHYSSTGPDEDLMFVEFFVPAEYRTVWENERRICTWVPTGKDSRGGKPTREIRAHDSQSAAAKVPEDL